MNKQDYWNNWFTGLLDQCGSFEVEPREEKVELTIQVKKRKDRNRALFEFLRTLIGQGEIVHTRDFDMYKITDPVVLREGVFPRLYNLNKKISTARYKLLSSVYFQALAAENFLNHENFETSEPVNGYSPFLLDLLDKEYSSEKKENLNKNFKKTVLFFENTDLGRTGVDLQTIPFEIEKQQKTLYSSFDRQNHKRSLVYRPFTDFLNSGYVFGFLEAGLILKIRPKVNIHTNKITNTQKKTTIYIREFFLLLKQFNGCNLLLFLALFDFLNIYNLSDKYNTEILTKKINLKNYNETFFISCFYKKELCDQLTIQLNNIMNELNKKEINQLFGGFLKVEYNIWSEWSDRIKGEVLGIAERKKIKDEKYILYANFKNRFKETNKQFFFQLV